MTRILFWNVKDFDTEKILSTENEDEPGTGITRKLAAETRLTHMTSLINKVQPHIFVMVGVKSSDNHLFNFGNDIALSEDSSIYINFFLNNGLFKEGNSTIFDAWSLVPPLNISNDEVVSIFYRHKNLVFTGPYLWSGNGAAEEVVAPKPYDKVKSYNLLDREIRKEAQYNVGKNEQTVAARTKFTYAQKIEHLNGNDFTYTDTAPYMVTFAEINDDKTVKRNISLFAVHSKQKNFVKNLSSVAQIVDNLGAKEVRVVMGGFNSNLMYPSRKRNSSYNALVEKGYTLALDPLNSVPSPLPDGYDGYDGYFATHIKKPNEAILWSTHAKPTYYPGYGYMSEKDSAIDNIFTRYGADIVPPANNNFTIMNSVVGTPFAPLGNTATPRGTIELDSAMGNPISVPYKAPAKAPQFTHGSDTSIRSWDNYGHIYSVSDHFALAIDV